MVMGRVRFCFVRHLTGKPGFILDLLSFSIVSKYVDWVFFYIILLFQVCDIL